MKCYSSSIWCLNCSHVYEIPGTAWYKFASYVLCSHSSYPLPHVGCNYSVMAELNGLCIRKMAPMSQESFLLEVKSEAAWRCVGRKYGYHFYKLICPASIPFWNSFSVIFFVYCWGFLQAAEDVLCEEHAVLFLAVMNWTWAKPVTEKSIADTDLVRHYVDLVGSEEDMVDNKTDPQTVVPVSSSPWVSKGSALALQTAMSLISMTSPRNFQLRSNALAPSFVEFDMSMEGYGYCCCCFSL